MTRPLCIGNYLGKIDFTNRDLKSCLPYSRYLCSIERLYNHCLYHNSTHAADVLHATMNLLGPAAKKFPPDELLGNHASPRPRTTKENRYSKRARASVFPSARSGTPCAPKEAQPANRQLFEPAAAAAAAAAVAAAAVAILASSCHDVGHPGVNNAFLSKQSHPLAVRCAPLPLLFLLLPSASVCAIE